MSTKISALDERLQADINGEEFFPIIDGTVGAYQTYKINLDQLFQSGQGYEKVTSLAVTDGATVLSNNSSFTLEYTQEDNNVQSITIDKYAIQNNDVAFSHIDPAGYITSTQTLANNLTDAKLATAKSVDEHIDYREALYDTQIKGYIGDDNSGVLADFATLANVATDFTNLLDGVKPELNTFKKIEDQFDTIDYSDKIGTSQVNTAHFRINDTDLNKRLNIKDSGITANLISVNAITNDKISNNAVTRTKISNGAISNDKIADVTITEAKIKDGTLTPNKLSSGAPDWDNTQVNIPVDLNVNSDIFVNENIISKGTDFRLYNDTRAGTNVHSGRALVHNVGDRLTINYANDYTGGVNIRGIVTVPDQDDAAINAGGNRAVVTKEYVDAADVSLNPIAGDKIQDNAIALRHMSDNSVGTFEIRDDSITSEKIENIGPQWNANGDVIVSGKLTANGQTFTLGSNSIPNGNVSLSLLASVSGSSTITRKTGANGALLINNAGGNIDFSPGSGTSTKFQVSSSKSTVSNPLHITGAGSSTIAGTNFTNPALLVGSSTNGIAIDSNEILQKGNHLLLGVSDGASQNIYFKEGLNTVAIVHGNTGDIQATGGLITNTGIVRNNSDASRLILLGGKENKSGADIELYGINNTNHPGYAYYDADKHTFRSQDNTVVALTIDSKKKKVTLHAEGTATNHLVTKGYVDKNTFPKITTRDDITTRMDSGFYQTASASIAEGWPEDRGWYHLLTTTHSNTNNYHALQFAASYYDQEVYFRSTRDKGDREWNKLWHANNVGPNSGLDADLLDGKEASEFSLDGHRHDDRYRKLSTKIGKDDLTTGAPAWTSAGVSIPAILTVNNSATIGNSLTVGSSITLNGTDFKIFNSTRAGSGNTHSGRALVHGTSDRLIINYAKDYTGGVEVNGKVIAPNQTKALINSNNKALTTKEYVASEIAKIYPDDNYLAKTSSTNQSIKAALTINGTVYPGANIRDDSTYVKDGTNLLLKGSSKGVSGIFFQSEKDGTNINHASDFGYIQYHAHGIGNTTSEQSDLVIGVTNDAGGSVIDKVVIDVPGNNNFVLTPNNGTTEHKIWHEGNDGHNSGLDADLLDGNHASAFAKINTKVSVSTPTSANHATTKSYVDDGITNLANSKADVNHNHDTQYAAKDHTHSGFVNTSGNESISGYKNFTTGIKLSSNVSLIGSRAGTIDTLDVYANDIISFQTASRAERLKIDSAGNVIIGKTDTSPWDNSSGDGVGTVMRQDGVVGITRNNGTPLYVNRIGTASTIISARSNGSEKFIVGCSKDTAGKESPFLRLGNADVNKFCQIQFGDKTDHDIGRIIYYHNSDTMQFITNNTTKFRIHKDGGADLPKSTIAQINSSNDKTIATKEYVDYKVAGVSTGKLYHVNAVQKSRSYFLTHAYNSSSNVKPNATVKNYAMSIFPNLSAGDTVSVVWGYRTHDISNGTTYAFHYATTLYSVVNSSTWNVINNGRII